MNQSVDCPFCNSRVPILADGTGACPGCQLVVDADGRPLDDKPRRQAKDKPQVKAPTKAILAEQVDDDSSDDEPERPRRKKCPYCAEIVKAEAVVCKHCGRDFPQPTMNPTLVGGSTGIVFRVLFWLLIISIVPALILGLLVALIGQ